MVSSVPGRAPAGMRPMSDRGSSEPSRLLLTPETSFEAMRGGDPLLARIFSDMQLLIGIGDVALAHHLGTAPDVVRTLKSGGVPRGIGPDERNRVVGLLAEIAGIDAAPIQRRLAMLAGPGGEAPKASLPPQRTVSAPPAKSPSSGAAFPNVLYGRETATQPVTVTARTLPPRTRPADTPPPPRRAHDPRPQPQLDGARRRLAATAIWLAVGAGLIGSVAAVVAFPSIGYRIAALAPAPVAAPIRNALDAMVLSLAPKKDGLRWVDVDNPSARRQDRLRPN